MWSVDMNSTPETELTIYLDESGDLGFSANSSQYLTIACLAIPTANVRALKKAVRDVKQRLKLPRRAELHATKDRWAIRQQVLALVTRPELAMEVRALSVYKPKAQRHFRDDPNSLYNYTSGTLLIPWVKHLSAARLVVDRRQVKMLGLPFQLDAYLRFRLEQEEQASTELAITHEDSFVSLGVQVADAVSNALWRRRERGDDLGYEVLIPVLREERVLFAP